MPAYTIPTIWLIWPAALLVLVAAFIGPTLVAITRKVDGLGEFMLFNAVCFVMPVGLIVVWVMAFTWPRREPPARYVPYPPSGGPPPQPQPVSGARPDSFPTYSARTKARKS